MCTSQKACLLCPVKRIRAPQAELTRADQLSHHVPHQSPALCVYLLAVYRNDENFRGSSQCRRHSL